VSIRLRVALIAVSVVIAGIAIASTVMVSSVVGHWFFRDSIRLFVHNDTTHSVTLATCGIDLTTIGPGGTISIYPFAKDPREGCVVYVDDTRHVFRCLNTPTTRLQVDSVVELSTYVPGIPLEHCSSR
jgi:hypothetical protein